MEIIQNNHVISTIHGIIVATLLDYVQVKLLKAQLFPNYLGFKFELRSSEKVYSVFTLPSFQK